MYSAIHTYNSCTIFISISCHLNSISTSAAWQYFVNVSRSMDSKFKPMLDTHGLWSGRDLCWPHLLWQGHSFFFRSYTCTMDRLLRQAKETLFLFGVFRHIRECFIHLKTSPLPVKSYKFWPMLGTHGHWAVKFL